jgi:hypothetical protein
MSGNGNNSARESSDGAMTKVTPKTMEARGHQLGSGIKPSRSWPFIRRVDPYPPKDSHEMPGPVAEVYQLCVRKTRDHERDYYQEDAADTKTIERVAGLDLPSPSQRLRSSHYFPLMFAFGVSEACVNMIIFLVLAMSRTGTYLASIMLALGLPVLAHYAGKAWKQINQSRQNRVVMWTAVSAAVVIVTSIAVIRCAYVSVTMQTLLNIHLSPVVVTLVFWGMNLAIFAAATLASHAHAIANPEGEKLGLEVVAAGERLARNRERRSSLRHEYRTLCQQCDADFKALAAAFFHGNMEARRRIDPEPPVWILYLPDVPIPNALRRNPDTDGPTSVLHHAVALSPGVPSLERSISTTWTKGNNGGPHHGS